MSPRRCRLWTVALSALLGVAVLRAPPAAQAQTSWDARQYSAWIDEGTELYEEALSLPPEALWRRHELLRESARAKLLARAMLRAALVAGQVDAFRQDAVAEYFNLCENLIVHLSTLDQCDAASLLIDQVEADVAIVPDGSLTDLRNFERAVDECRERTARSDPSWDIALWQRLTSEADGWRQQAAAAGSDRAVAADLRFEAAQFEQASLDLLRRTLLGTGDAPGVDAPVSALLAHYPRLIDDLVAIGACAAARRRLLQWRFDVELLNGDAPDIGGALEGCTADRTAPLR